MFACLQCLHCLWVVQERRRGNVDQVNILSSQQHIDILEIGDSEALRHGKSGLAMRRCHANKFYPWSLNELLKREESEPSRTQGPDANALGFHTLPWTVSRLG